MQTKLLDKGHVALPVSIRRKLAIKKGDEFHADIQNGNIVLTPTKKKVYKTWIGKSPITGLPVLMAEKGAPKLTSEQVAEMLADFP
jgi:bifunctional DNA-binding transcriptional regulator/antitoxin component of YhaV-PrlF toxin-antitoxin module